MNRAAPCELMKNTPLCGARLVYEPLSEADQKVLDLVGGSEPPPEIVCERRAGHPGSHYGQAVNRTAMWDDEVIYEHGRDLDWATFHPRGNYLGIESVDRR